jgi:hypothetical protein
MDASIETRTPGWLKGSFWELLRRLEDEHQRLQSAHEEARRNVERLGIERAGEHDNDLRVAWSRYCDVIAELDQTTAEIETLRSQV